MELNGGKIWKTQVLWGKQRGVVLVPCEQKLFIERDEIIILSLPENMTEKEKNAFLKDALKDVLCKEIAILMPKWEKITGLKCRSWFIGKSRGAWGWCRISDRKIMLNEGLVYKPKGCLEYVICHELCHLDQANHGKWFADLLNKHMPNWREFEVLLNGKIPGYGKWK